MLPIESVGNWSRLITGGVLVLTSLSKLMEFKWFKGVLLSYELVPKRLAPATAVLVVGMELVSGVLLLAGRLAPWPAYAAAGLFACFAGTIGINLVRGRFDVACGCSALWKNEKIGWQLPLIGTLRGLLCHYLPRPLC